MAGKKKIAPKKPKKKAAPKGKKSSARSGTSARAKAKPVKKVAKPAKGPNRSAAKRPDPKKAVPKKPAPKKVLTKPAPKKLEQKPVTGKVSAPGPAGKAKPAAKPAPSIAQTAKAATKPEVVPAAAKKEANKPSAKKPVVPKGPIMAVMTGVDPLSGPVRTLKRALKERFIVEHYVRSTPFALYELISTPSGFSKWFCDDVNVRGEEFTFIWGNDEQTAEVLSRKQGELIRLHWKDDEDEGSFFELRIRIDALTNEVAMVITDHAWPNELDKARQLWESQMTTLQRVLGA